MEQLPPIVRTLEDAVSRRMIRSPAAAAARQAPRPERADEVAAMVGSGSSAGTSGGGRGPMRSPSPEVLRLSDSALARAVVARQPELRGPLEQLRALGYTEDALNAALLDEFAGDLERVQQALERLALLDGRR